MPQIFQILKCYKCLTFQVHQTKKSVKWECKLCGEKQSLKRHYGIGTGKDCRIQVQKLNMARGELDENKILDSEASDTDEDLNVKQTHNSLKVKRKWSKFVEEKSENDEFTSEVVLDMPKKKSKKFHVQLAKTQQKIYSGALNNQSDTDIESIDVMHSNNNKNNHLKSYKDCYQSASITESNVKRNNFDNVNKLNFNSKWAPFMEDISNNNDINSTLDDSNVTLSTQLMGSNNNTQTVIPENITVETNSKRPQFIQKMSAFDQSKDSTGHHTLFSLCSDNDLDDVLNI